MTAVTSTPATWTASTCARDLAGAGFEPGQPLAVVVADTSEVGLAWPGGRRRVDAGSPGQVGAVLADLAGLDPRWTWWSARQAAPGLLGAGVAPRACWDVGAVGRLMHGLRRDDAREVLSIFIREAHKQGIRCVRVVHGKGLGSPGKAPVLKNRVHSWLVQKNEVLAFVQAKPADGGAGALVVLLMASRA